MTTSKPTKSVKRAKHSASERSCAHQRSYAKPSVVPASGAGLTARAQRKGTTVDHPVVHRPSEHLAAYAKTAPVTP